jgi:hypothetical protein
MRALFNCGANHSRVWQELKYDIDLPISLQYSEEGNFQILAYITELCHSSPTQ